MLEHIPPDGDPAAPILVTPEMKIAFSLYLKRAARDIQARLKLELTPEEFSAERRQLADAITSGRLDFDGEVGRAALETPGGKFAFGVIRLACGIADMAAANERKRVNRGR